MRDTAALERPSNMESSTNEESSSDCKSFSSGSYYSEDFGAVKAIVVNRRYCGSESSYRRTTVMVRAFAAVATERAMVVK